MWARQAQAWMHVGSASAGRFARGYHQRRHNLPSRDGGLESGFSQEEVSESIQAGGQPQSDRGTRRGVRRGAPLPAIRSEHPVPGPHP